MPKPLPASFYRRPAEVVARELVGCVLRTPRADVRLVETEAYLPVDDDACHASRGATPRTLPMFEAGGILYVYFIYGMYWCSNIVVDVKGRGSAVLLRAVVVEEEHSSQSSSPLEQTLVQGPGRLSRYLAFDGSYTGRSVLKGSDITVVQDQFTADYQNRIVATPRIGISVAKDLLLRFVDESIPHTYTGKGIRRLRR